MPTLFRSNNSDLQNSTGKNKNVFQQPHGPISPRGRTPVPFCFALPYWKHVFFVMDDNLEESGENTGDLLPQRSSRSPLDLGDEGKRVGQTLLADHSFIKVISSAIVSGLSDVGKPHGSASLPELHVPGSKRSAGVLDGPGDESVGKSVDSTRASQSAKYFKRDFPFQREIELGMNVDDATEDVAVQGESPDVIKATSARWQASKELSTFLGTTRKPLSRPNMDGAFTPSLGSYLPRIMGGLPGPNAS